MRYLKIPRLVVSLLLGSFLLFAVPLLVWRPQSPLSAFRSALDRQLCSTPSHDQDPTSLQASHPQVRKNIALSTCFSFHHDVMFALAWTIQRILQGPGGTGQFTVYSPSPLSWNFQDIVSELDLYHGPRKSHEDFIRDITDDHGIDLVILATCEIDMRDWGTKILEVWDARDENHKFLLVCIVHNVMDTGWQRFVPDWSRRNAIRYLTISPNVASAFQLHHAKLSDDPDPAIHSAGYEHIPVDVHPPILDFPYLSDLPPNRTLSNAVIQGFFDPERRDYDRIFQQLITYFEEDPESWGYLPLGPSSPSYTPSPSSRYTPFHLHLAGGGSIDIPPVLAQVVVVHTNLDYNQFYTLIAQMDVCIPAFAGTDDRYLFNQASSTVAMCMEMNTPLLVTHRIRSAYTFIDDDRVTITRPSVVLEMEAIKALRTGSAASILSSDPSQSGRTLGSHPRIRLAVEKMMRDGFDRPKEGFSAVKREIWERNEEVVWRLLRDL